MRNMAEEAEHSTWNGCFQCASKHQTQNRLTVDLMAARHLRIVWVRTRSSFRSCYCREKSSTKDLINNAFSFSCQQLIYHFYYETFWPIQMTHFKIYFHIFLFFSMVRQQKLVRSSNGPSVINHRMFLALANRIATKWNVKYWEFI